MNDTKTKTGDMPAGLAELSFGSGRAMLQIDTMEKAWRLAKLRSVAKTVDPDSPEALTICILYGQEVGLTPLMAMEKIALINGRPTIWGDGALALVMTNPLFEDIEERIEGVGDERVAYCTVKRQNLSAKTSTFSVADAKQAGLWDDRPTVKRKMKYDGWFQGKKVSAGEWAELPNDAPWYKYQDRMLQMRARGFRLHDSFPDVLGGMYLREELMGSTIEHDASETPAARPARLPEPPPPPPVDLDQKPGFDGPYPGNAAVAEGSRNTATNEGPPAPPPHHVTEATITGGHHVEIVPPKDPDVTKQYADNAGGPPPPPSGPTKLSAFEIDHLMTLFEERVREAVSEDDLDIIWGDLVTPLVDADRLDDATLDKLQNIDDERRGVLQQ